VTAASSDVAIKERIQRVIAFPGGLKVKG
jgi:hypothetical protein